ncbi:ATP synthase subunit s-like isoform X1 [Leptotrombidium deliense]|uniref:ATP synthase subunit s-like isoform X1 n=1 Tax=Leptotrombidium deliense TaxID=299467 RepID=A0A443SHX2_9ACAR|nr:ATP synthase subunit s-like isoform X1 [Leptotrombidium deliense]
MLFKRLITLFSSKTVTSCLQRSNRPFWGWLNSISNRFDESRVKEVGVEVAAAEWLVRNGALVKWTKSDAWHNDYNSLPKHNPGQNYIIEEIDATDSCIMSVERCLSDGLKNVKKFIIKRNHYLDNEALFMLVYLKTTLKHLEISSCSNVTEEGILSLKEIQLSTGKQGKQE